MGKSKTTVESNTTSVQKAEMSPEERERYNIENQQLARTAGPQTDVQLQGLNLINQLLSGNANLPGFFGEMGKGIDSNMADQIANESVNDIMPMLQQQGLMGQPVGAYAASRTAGDVRRGVAEFNIGNKQNLLNLALSGQAQVQSPILQQQGIMANRLAGLRTVTGSSSGMQTSKNPFLTGKDIFTGIGAGLGAFAGR
jgi:hypothetical protein